MVAKSIVAEVVRLWKNRVKNHLSVLSLDLTFCEVIKRIPRRRLREQYPKSHDFGYTLFLQR